MKKLFTDGQTDDGRRVIRIAQNYNNNNIILDCILKHNTQAITNPLSSSIILYVCNFCVISESFYIGINPGYLDKYDKGG